MREDTKVTKVYRFEELSDKARQEAMEKLYDINVNYDWWDCVYEDAKNIGVKIEEFDLRRSYCRGTFIRDELDVAEAILKEHGKDCETYKDAYDFVWDLAIAEKDDYNDKRREMTETGEEFCYEDWKDGFEPDCECPELLEGFRQTIFEDYRIILQEEYDYLTSEEVVRETIDANDYEFTEDGRIY